MYSSSQIDNIRQKVYQMYGYFKMLNYEITANLKLFDDIKLENKQAYYTVNRNLDDVKYIYENDLRKFEESVDKSVNYNYAIFQRVEKDACYLQEDQENLLRKIMGLERQIGEMEGQIGTMEYS